jgi:hypothetical protein
MSYIDNDIFYSKLGYSTTVIPKRSSKYDYATGRMKKNESRTLADMIKAEKAYAWTLKALSKTRFNDIMKSGQVKPGDRTAVFYFKNKEADYALNNFISFNLQKGLIYNLPINRMRNLTGNKLVTMSYEIAKGRFQEGTEPKLFVRAVRNYIKAIEKKCHKEKVEATDSILQLSLIGLNNKFIFDVKIWSRFLSYGLTVEEVSFALSKELNPKWASGELNVNPETAKDLHLIPQEWLNKIFL